MSNPAFAAIETALRSRKLDRTLTTALPLRDPGASPATMGDAYVASTGLAALDARLGGGLPRGQLSEIAGPRSSGRTTVLLQILTAATRRGEMAALVDTSDAFDVESAADAGVELDRLLWIRAQGPGLGPQGAPARAGTRGLGPEPFLDRALKAFNLVLQAGHVGVVALDMADVPPPALARIPLTTWLRVQRTIEGSETACVIVVPQPLARSAGGLTLSLAGRTCWTGDAPRSRRLGGLEATIRIVSPRRWAEGTVSLGARIG